MYEINFSKPAHAYFIGIGGISMSGFAELLHDAGFKVSGSDAKESKITRHLEAAGLNILYGQSSANITDDIDFIVYTAAIHPDNPEYRTAVEKNIPMMERAQMVGQVMANYETAIAVAGTHGKTTTTSMISQIFLDAGMDPTISVGGILPSIGGNIHIGKSQNFITEACEYTNSFLKFHPTAGIILNIEEDHMDFFKDINDIRRSFTEFCRLIPEDGVLVINSTIDALEAITQSLPCKVLTCSIHPDGSDFCADNITYDEQGCASFTLLVNGRAADTYRLSVQGEHNIENALAAIALSYHYGIPADKIRSGLLAFSGTERRFEYKGSLHGITVIDDYAHHPTEIAATLAAAEKYPHKRLWCVFQPHTYSRTKAFLKEFAHALSGADNVVLAAIYPAREKDPGDISSEDIKKELEKLGKTSHYFPTFDEIENFLLQNCTTGDLLITMGAGDVVSIGESLLNL